MLTEFEVSSLASKCVFYRPEHKRNGILKFLECKDEINQHIELKD